MKASVYKKYGPPEVLSIQNLDKPVPKSQELLVNVYAATVNRTDCAMLKANPFIMRFLTGMFKPKNPILGTDFAGKVEAVGEGVTKFKAGDKVFGFDDRGLSSHGQYMTIHEDNSVANIPDNITFELAAASIEGAHYAYNFINKVNLKKGQKVLVYGASGAIGSAMVQLLKYFGAGITAVTNSESMNMVKSIGADTAIDYTKNDFTRANEKYDYVFDAVGKISFNKCKTVLVPGGVYISSELGWMAQNLFYSLITPVTFLFSGGRGKKVKFPLPVDKPGSVLLIKRLIEEGNFTPVIDRRYPLDEIAEAFGYVLKGQKTGNVVIFLKD